MLGMETMMRSKQHLESKKNKPMPLRKCASQNCFERNLKNEMKHGKPQKQALAIAYAVQKKAKSKKK